MSKESLLKEINIKVDTLEKHFKKKLEVNYDFDRKLVSFQANKSIPAYRWYKYKEAFSAPLVKNLLESLGVNEGNLIDPFAGAGTALFASSENGMRADGIELLPIGCEIVKIRQIIDKNKKALVAKLEVALHKRPWEKRKSKTRFNHLNITKGAFSNETEEKIEKYLSYLDKQDLAFRELLIFALLCIIEEVSFTRKDGQYLRWDSRSSRSIKSTFNKGQIPSFDEAIVSKLKEMLADLQEKNQDLFSALAKAKKKGNINLHEGSCLEILPTLKKNDYDCLFTSPPYCNRYDYTRTYALELALLGVDEENLKRLRQTMLSCTVENRNKENLAEHYSARRLNQLKKIFDSQECLQSVLSYLSYCKDNKLLNNAGIVRMVENYFWEMLLCISECSRVLKRNAPFVMVNDNVRYQGVEVPVDLILSAFAEKVGFKVEKIWALSRGKGNSSQQMGAHGRKEIRKCIYLWRSTKG